MNLVARTALLPFSRWAQESQRTACRNAMVASTALASRRAEAAETQEYVRTTLARRSGRTSEGGTLLVPLVAQHRR
jgi:hypothetical protein